MGTLETPAATAMAEVMVYNEAKKKWQTPDNSELSSMCRIEILHHTRNQSFRIIGIRERDGIYVLNCNVHAKLKYHPATSTFHQWRDEQRQVYGLNFANEADARNFVSVMGQAIDFLNHQMLNGDYQMVQNDAVYQDPHAHQQTGTGGQHSLTHIHSAPAMAHEEQLTHGMVHNSLHSQFRKSSHSTLGQQANGHSPSSQSSHQQQASRRASQGSSVSSQDTNHTNHLNSATPFNGPTSSASPQRAAAPPAPPPPPSASIPPPPPPPPANLFSANSAKGPSLADQLKNPTLRKTGGPQQQKAPGEVGGNTSATAGTSTAAPTCSSQPVNFISELAATINKRKLTQAKADAIDSKSNISNGSSDSGCAIPPVNGFAVGNGVGGVKRWGDAMAKTGGGVSTAAAQQSNGVASNGSTDSPKTHRKVPSGSSISSQDETKAVNANGVSNSQLTHEILEKFKAELMVEIRLEINKAKQELIDVVRQELARR